MKLAGLYLSSLVLLLIALCCTNKNANKKPEKQEHRSDSTEATEKLVSNTQRGPVLN